MNADGRSAAGIRYVQGDLFQSGADVLVNAVNVVGVMGKGIALSFKQRFPANFGVYRDACSSGALQPGGLVVSEQLCAPRWIVNVATKAHWRDPSRIEWVRDGLWALRAFLVEQRVGSVALPALGAGNGGLPWSEVKAEIESALAGLDAVAVLVYLPHEQPVAGGSAPAFSWLRRGGYEVSTRGDARFSAFNATLEDGRTLEMRYQCDVKGYLPGGRNWRLGKGKPPLDPSVDLWAAYLALWERWARRNPELMVELRQRALERGGRLSDCFASTPVNQAHALSKLLDVGYGGAFPPSAPLFFGAQGSCD